MTPTTPEPDAPQAVEPTQTLEDFIARNNALKERDGADPSENLREPHWRYLQRMAIGDLPKREQNILDCLKDIEDATKFLRASLAEVALLNYLTGKTDEMPPAKGSTK